MGPVIVERPEDRSTSEDIINEDLNSRDTGDVQDQQSHDLGREIQLLQERIPELGAHHRGGATRRQDGAATTTGRRNLAEYNNFVDINPNINNVVPPNDIIANTVSAVLKQFSFNGNGPANNSSIN